MITLATPSRATTSPGVLLMTGIVLAALTEAISSTVLSLGRADILGDTYATPDEFASLDVGYTAAKLMSFLAAAWLMTRSNPRNVLLVSVLVMGLAPGAYCSSRDRQSFFSPMRLPGSRFSRRFLQSAPSLHPQRSCLRFMAGCSIPSPGNGSSSASCPSPCSRPGSC
jgi:hypothetical protein